ncbi:hypothetical protein JCM16303_005026 [Sporobolomyces ruberrimus]
MSRYYNNGGNDNRGGGGWGRSDAPQWRQGGQQWGQGDQGYPSRDPYQNGRHDFAWNGHEQPQNSFEQAPRPHYNPNYRGGNDYYNNDNTREGWRGQSNGYNQGRGGWNENRSTNYNSRRSDDSIWSTGDYRPLPPRRPNDGSRSPSPARRREEDPSTNGYTTPERRQKLHRRTAPVPTPSEAYLEATSLPSSASSSTSEREPLILILDLNHTLLCRSERNYFGSKVPLVRPYLSTFLEYITTSTLPSSSSSSPTFLPIVFSSARYRNVLSLLVALNLVPSSRLPPPLPPWNPYGRPPTPPPSQTYECKEEEGDVLKLVWTRENMGLNVRDFKGDVETTKDLEGVWKALGLGEEDEAREGEGEKRRNVEGAKRTILLDDEVSKAAQQPHSLLPIKPFLLSREDFPPQQRPPSPKPSSSSSSSPPPPPPLPAAVELSNPDHPAWEDKSLLSTIYKLDSISKWENVGYEIREGGLEGIEKSVREELEKEKGEGREVSEREVEVEMEKRGEKLVRDAGIEVRKEWDKGWRERVLGKLKERKK